MVRLRLVSLSNIRHKLTTSKLASNLYLGDLLFEGMTLQLQKKDRTEWENWEIEISENMFEWQISKNLMNDKMYKSNYKIWKRKIYMTQFSTMSNFLTIYSWYD